jgi:hypothetical protein
MNIKMEGSYNNYLKRKALKIEWLNAFSGD